MKQTEITLSKNADGSIPYLSTVLEKIPTNTILCKTLTGLGATYSECKAQRNSIIIEPNLPVIIGKCKSEVHKDDGLFGVFKGVRIDQIIEYINKRREEDGFIKLMTTPESFPRVKSAVEKAGMRIENDYFLLFDECHKVVQDNDYRKTITLPMDFFFDCNNKAMVSATPLEFTDPRFDKFNFEELIIRPDFEYGHFVSIYGTGSIKAAIKKLVDFDREEDVYFIFCNSVSLIMSIIKELKIEDMSKVFCSSNSCNLVKSSGFKNVSDVYGDIATFNFMTSRFFNAFDIELDFSADVIMITDSVRYEETILDPATDIVQIIGRFRKEIGSVTHIVKIGNNLTVKERKEVMKYLECQEEIYNSLRIRAENATCNEYAQAFRDAYKSLKYNDFIDDHGQKDYFAIDNYITSEYVRSLYGDIDTLDNAYRETKGIIRFSPLMMIYDYEKDFGHTSLRLPIKERRMQIVDMLLALGSCESDFDQQIKEELRQEDNFIVDAYDLLGSEEIKRLDYDRKKIGEAMILHNYNKQCRGNEIILCIHNSFTIGRWYSCDDTKKELKRIYNLFGIVPPQAITSRTIEDYFIVRKNKRKNVRGYVIEGVRI